MWATIFLMLGYFFGTINWVQTHLQVLVVAIIIISVMPAVIEFVHEKHKLKHS
jgi:membrane-associated protein